MTRPVVVAIYSELDPGSPIGQGIERLLVYDWVRMVASPCPIVLSSGVPETNALERMTNFTRLDYGDRDQETELQPRVNTRVWRRMVYGVSANITVVS